MSQKAFYVAVRIREYNVKSGNVARRYTVAGKRFDIDHGWYKVQRSMGERLEKERHPDTGALVFDVVELDEAVEMDETDPMPDSAVAAKRATAVKGREFTRLRQVVALENEDDVHPDDDLDKILMPNKAKEEREFDEDFDPENDEKVDEREAKREESEAKKAESKKKPAGGKKKTKKKSSRRSQSK